jgi:hypothetical protein
MQVTQKLIIFLFCAVVFNVKAQIKGIVIGTDEFGKKETLIGAQVFLLKSQKYAVTNNKGYFELGTPTELPDALVVHSLGFHSDTIQISSSEAQNIEITLFSKTMTGEVLILARSKGTSIKKLDPLLVQNLSENEFRKAACCNISEAFETNASVDVSMPDPISGARRIQMLGLDGIYTQINIENIPYFRGLSYAFGMASIPGT